MKVYRFASPITLKDADGAFLRALRVDFVNGEATLEVGILDGDTPIDARSVSFTVQQLDNFIDNAASFPGDGFAEKVLALLAQPLNVLPDGGTIEDA